MDKFCILISNFKKCYSKNKDKETIKETNKQVKDIKNTDNDVYRYLIL
jgi:hypothetical protein